MHKKRIKALLFMKADSERVPGKNMRLLCGRPLFHWILDALNDSGVIDEIIINTDSEEIANNAKKYFNVTIHMRPEYLLDINSNEAYQIMNYDLMHVQGEYFIQTHSTNPLVKPITIKKAIETYFENIINNDSLFSVIPFQKRIYDNKGVGLNHDPAKLIKTQNLHPLYEENSCIYIFSRESFLRNKNRLGGTPYMYSMDKEESVDIDEKFDFILAESIMRKRLEKN
jgi:CMP-N-acetylneuraminic acid synthetase